MLVFEPPYYRDFCCLAARCPDSCCKEWEVEIDEKSAAFYRSLSGSLGARLRQVMREDADWGTMMTIEDGRCPMWRADGLCRIQAELGHDALCKTCRDFPRLCHDYGSFQELGLELSCPEAARLILTAPDFPGVVQNLPGGDAPNYDTDAMQTLLETRKIALDILRNSAYSANRVLALLLYYGYQAQSILDGEEVPDFDADSALAEMERFALPGDGQAMVDFFRDLDILTPEWKERLSLPLSPLPWSDAFRKLARYFVERYWLQAVSDYDLISRVKLAVTSCIVIRLLGGDLHRTAQLYSKEIENSSENMDALLDAAYTSPAFTDQRLFGFLL